jgi:hypothetical protein
MRKLLVMLTMAATLIVPATASASKSGAQRAVKREINFDYGRVDMAGLFVVCHGSARYACDIGFIDRRDNTNWVTGRARVTQRGRRYSVSYRIYW